MNIWLHGVTVSSFINEEGVKVLTNIESKPRSDGSSVHFANRTNFVPLINRMASLHGVNEELVQAIIKVESDFNPRAVSSKNCKGLMQLHPDTAQRFGVRDIFDPTENIEGGIRYLNFLMDFFDHKLDYVLAAYNAGENAVRRHQGIPPFGETRSYVKKVKELFQGSLAPSQGSATPKRRIHRVILPDGQVLFTNVLQSELRRLPSSELQIAN